MTNDNIMAGLPYWVTAPMRYAQPPLGLNEHSTRLDVRRVRHLLPQVDGIGAARLAMIDAWLATGGRVKS